MMSATRLTEPEKKELDWESRREQRKLESQQFEARREKWRLKFQQLLRNIISESGGEVAEGKELSCVQEEDQQVEIQWPKLEARLEAHCRRMDAKFDALKKAILDLSLQSEGRSMATTDANSGSYCSTDFKQLESPLQETEELELPHVEGPRSYNLESHESGWDVQRSTATMDENDGSRGSHVRAGAVHQSCSTDRDPMESNLSPIADLHNLRQVSSVRKYIDAFGELYSRVDIEEVEALSLFLSGLVEELQTPVRRFTPKTLADAYALAKLQELTLTGVLPSLYECEEQRDNSWRYENLNMELKVSGFNLLGEEVIEVQEMKDIDDKCSSLNSAENLIMAVSEFELAETLDRKLSELSNIENSKNDQCEKDLAANLDNLGSLIENEKIRKGWGDNSSEFAKLSSEENGVSIEVSVGEILCACQEIDETHVQMDDKVVASVIVASKLGWLASKWFTTPKVKMKTDGVGLGVLTAASALMETHEFGKEMEHVVDNFATFGKGKDNSTYCAQFATSLMVHRSYYLSLQWLLDWDPKPKVKMKLMKFSSRPFYEEKSTDLGTVDKEISKEVSIALDMSGVEPSQWGSLSRTGRMLRPLVHYRGERTNENEDNYLSVMFISQQKSLILIANKEVSEMISGKGFSLRVKGYDHTCMVYGGDEAYEVCWQCLAKELETGESALRRIETDTQMLANNSIDVLMRVLRWIQERSVARLLEALVRSNGQIRSASEAAGERERVLYLKRLSVVQGHYLSWEWLFAWFPRPMVKKVKRLVSVIPWGQGILRGIDCYGHKLKREKKLSSIDLIDMPAGGPHQPKQK